LILFLVGFVGGFLGSMLGLGGGIIVVPALSFWVLILRSGRNKHIFNYSGLVLRFGKVHPFRSGGF